MYAFRRDVYCLPCVFAVAATAPPGMYTLSLHDALPIFSRATARLSTVASVGPALSMMAPANTRRFSGTSPPSRAAPGTDRKSTRLNSSHVAISYAVFCLKKKNEEEGYYLDADCFTASPR